MGQFRDQFLASGDGITPLDAHQYMLDHVRRRFPLMTVGTLSTFLFIGGRWRGEPTTPTEIAERKGIPLPTVFRQCDQLSRGVAGRNAMGLIEKVPSAKDGRARALRPTLKGIQLLIEINDILTPADNEEVG